MSFAKIETFNQSAHACKISAVLETDQNDEQMATKVAIGNPLARDDSPDSLANLETLLN